MERDQNIVNATEARDVALCGGGAEWKQFTILVGASTFYASTADEDWGGKEGEGMEKLVLPPTLGLDTWVGRAEVARLIILHVYF